MDSEDYLDLSSTVFIYGTAANLILAGFKVIEGHIQGEIAMFPDMVVPLVIIEVLLLFGSVMIFGKGMDLMEEEEEEARRNDLESRIEELEKQVSEEERNR